MSEPNDYSLPPPSDWARGECAFAVGFAIGDAQRNGGSVTQEGLDTVARGLDAARAEGVAAERDSCAKTVASVRRMYGTNLPQEQHWDEACRLSLAAIRGRG